MVAAAAAFGKSGHGVNFQVTVLKILVSYPDGFAVMPDLKRDMAILATSGREWADRTRRLAVRVPDLDLFSQGLVERLNGGWKITDKGRAVLDFMEARPVETQAELGAIPVSEKATPRLLASTKLARSSRLQRRRAARVKARAKA